MRLSNLYEEGKWQIVPEMTWRNSVNFGEVWKYRDLLKQWIRRDFLLTYQQTILGPLWVLVQPVLTLFIYLLVFDKLIQIPTGNIPSVLFYFSGIILWTLFSEIFTGTAFVIKQNASLFNKVFFPRLIIPLAVAGSQLLRFGIHLVLLLALIGYYAIVHNQPVRINTSLLLLLPIVMATSMMAVSAGLLCSVLTAKYRDLSNLVHTGVRLLMFVTPVLYPLHVLPREHRWIVQMNPLSSLFEAFRLALLGEGSFSWTFIIGSVVFALVLMVGSCAIFSRQAPRLLDVI